MLREQARCHRSSVDLVAAGLFVNASLKPYQNEGSELVLQGFVAAHQIDVGTRHVFGKL